MKKILAMLFMLSLITIISCGSSTSDTITASQNNDSDTQETETNSDSNTDEVKLENTSEACAATEAKGFEGICTPRAEIGLLGEMSEDECNEFNEGLPEEDFRHFVFYAEYREDLGCIEHCVNTEIFFSDGQGGMYEESNCPLPNKWIETGLDFPPDHCATPDMQKCESNYTEDSETSDDGETTGIINCTSFCDDLYSSLIEMEFSEDEALNIIEECKEGCEKSNSCDEFCTSFCEGDPSGECSDWCPTECEE